MFAIPSVDNNGQPLTIREAEDFNEKVLRDWFAGLALCSGSLNEDPGDKQIEALGLPADAKQEHVISAIAYLMADCMLAARDRKPSKAGA